MVTATVLWSSWIIPIMWVYLR